MTKIVPAAHWNPRGAPRIGANVWVWNKKKEVRTTGTQGRPEDLRDRVDGFSITPGVFLLWDACGAPRAGPAASRVPRLPSD